MRVTIKDIAKEAGVSTTTVSLVLNNRPHRIPPETCRLVVQAARKLNYHPNQLAVGLVKNATHVVGALIPDISNVFFAEIIKGIENKLDQEGYHLILFNSDDRHKREIALLQTMKSQLVDGLVMILASDTIGEKEEETMDLIRSSGVPTILIDCFNHSEGFSTVSVDNYKASSDAVEYLIALGHQRIACICGPLGLKTNDDRLQGYRDALARHQLPSGDDMVYVGDFRYPSGVQAIPYLLPSHPTAILGLNDMMAYGAMNALSHQGIRVPEEISIMGFDDIFFSKMTAVPLTTVHQPIYEMGQKAGELVLSEIQHRGGHRQISFDASITTRSSTRKIER